MIEPRRLGIILLPILVICGGFGVFGILKATRPTAQKSTLTERALVVEVTSVKRATHQITVPADGIAIAARSIQVRAEVSGRVTSQSPKLIPGGQFRAGERILQIDPRDYQIALQQQKASVGRAQLELQVERGRKNVAKREWELLKKKRSSAPGNALVFREPQLAAAQLAVDAAESGLERAELNLARTVLRAPFNCFVQNKSVDLGQLVTPQSPLGALVGTDRFWVQVNIPEEQLGWLNIPQAGEGSAARIFRETNNQRTERKGRVIQLLGDLDPVGRMARLLVEIDDPLGLNPDSNTPKSDDIPVLLGGYVHVELLGKTIENVARVPREALQEGSRVLLLGPDSRLLIRQVTIAWRTRDAVFVTDGVEDGDKVITTRINSPIQGSLLQEAEGPSQTPRAAVPANNGTQP